MSDQRISKMNPKSPKDINLLIISNRVDEIANIRYRQIKRIIVKLRNKVIIVDYRNISAHWTLLPSILHILRALKDSIYRN